MRNYTQVKPVLPVSLNTTTHKPRKTLDLLCKTKKKNIDIALDPLERKWTAVRLIFGWYHFRFV
jgi:hypothetical protein